MRNKIKVVIVILIIFGIGTTIFALYTNIKSEIVSNIIQIWTCIAALILVVFVIYSYVQTNYAFISSQKPHLLLIALNLLQNGTSIHMTKIHYENKSNNPFYDLNILVHVSDKDTSVDLSNIFSPNMYMAAHDVRDMTFNTKEELSKRGFDLDAGVRANQTIILSLKYAFTFNRKKGSIKVQEYIWKDGNWSIK